MSTTTSTYLNGILSRRVLVIGLLAILGVAATTGFIWMQSDPVIAPPGLRMMDWFWRIFVCRCPV
jgi:hypothetical protein